MMSHALYKLGRYAARRPWTVIGTWLVVALLVVAAAGAFGQKLEDSMGAPGLDSQKAADLLSRTDHAGVTAQMVITPADRRTGAFRSTGLAELETGAARLPNVVGVSEPAISPDGRVAVIRIQYAVQEKLGPADLAQLKEFASHAPKDLRVELGGELFFAFEQPGTGLGEGLGLLVAVVILLVTFGSLIAMGLPIGLALFGLGLGVSSMSLITYLIDIPSWAPVIGSMVGLGVGIDYALFLVTRHREYLAQGLTVEESVGRAVATAGQSVVFAGGTVVIAILGLAVAGVPFMTAGGIAVSVIVLIMVVASITLLPAFLGLAGQWINRLGVRRLAQPRTEGWQRWARHVSRNAVVYLVGASIALLALAAPVLALRVGSPDEGSLPEVRTERRAYDLVAQGFGPGINGPLVIAVDTSHDPSVVQPLADALKADRGIASIAPPELTTGLATILAFPTTGPQADATVETIRRLRADVIPSVLRGSPATAHVGGPTASFADVGAKVNDRLPYFVGAVILMSVLLLILVFRSILVPLKAALMNLLSIGASFGIMVMVFQWGWGADLIGLETSVPIVPFIPMFMFAILFGLSMDYEVFLLSRVREEYVLTGDSTGSVVHGIATTGRLITSAALIMVSVFLGFVMSNDPSVKMFGLGLAVAIFIDATVVRMILVPAAMTLLGRANWWIPRWLDQLLPVVDRQPDIAVQPQPESAPVDTFA